MTWQEEGGGGGGGGGLGAILMPGYCNMCTRTQNLLADFKPSNTILNSLVLQQLSFIFQDHLNV